MSHDRDATTQRHRVLASTFMYPWDLADLGVRGGLERLRDDGFEAFELTATYHPITLHTPGAAGRRLRDLDRGAVLFPARSGRYGRIRPQHLPDEEVMKVWPEAAETAGALGLDLNSWTVALYQPWIADAYPDTARETPEGYTNPAGICPSSPDVREFLVAAAADIVGQFPIRTLQLEGVTFPFFDTGWRLPRVLIELSSWSRWLASLCFCVNCVTRASSNGIDVQGLRSRVCAELAAEYDRRGPIAQVAFEREHPEWLSSDADYAAFIAMRDDVCASLVEDIAAAVHEVSPTVSVGIWGPEEFDGTRLDLERVLPIIGLLQTRHPIIAPDNARAARAVADAHHLRVSAVHWCGGRIGPPWGPDFDAALRASVELRVDQINVFNWAMLRPWVASSIVARLRDIEASVHAPGVGLGR